MTSLPEVNDIVTIVFHLRRLALAFLYLVALRDITV